MKFTTKNQGPKKHRILHISDTHARFNNLKGKYDYIVHTGDFFPDFDYQMNKSFADQQQEWLLSNIEVIKDWIGPSHFLFVGGNHDHISGDTFETILLANGIEATNLHCKRVEHKGLSFYGLPFVPTINDCFNYELNEEEMGHAISAMAKVINTQGVDVIAAHCGLKEVLDYAYGNHQLNAELRSNIKKSKMPKAILHGHIHSHNGVTLFNNILISNAATTQHIIEIIK